MSKVLKRLLFVSSLSAYCLASPALLAECGKKACCDTAAKECSTEACKDKDCTSEKSCCDMKDTHCSDEASSEMHHE